MAQGTPGAGANGPVEGRWSGPMGRRSGSGAGTRGRQRRARSDSGGTGRAAVLSASCSLVQEALSAQLDGEPAPLGTSEVLGHLGRCRPCREFQAAAGSLGLLAPPVAPAVPSEQLVAAVVATRPRGRLGRRASRLAGRLGPVGRDRLGPAWAVPAMLVGVALPPAALAASTGLQPAHVSSRPPCNALLGGHRGLAPLPPVLRQVRLSQPMGPARG